MVRCVGITFSEVTTGGQMVFDDSEAGAFASSTRTGNTITRSNINISTEWLATSGTMIDSYSFQTYLHEIGHALGLGHGGNYNSTASYTQDASYLNDAWTTTVMSYFDQRENPFFNDQGFTRVFAVSPMSADIVAIQQTYGVATTTRTGDTTYGVGNTSGREIFGVGPLATNNAGNLLAFTIVDHGGIDTLNYSNFLADQTINLNAETFSSVGGSIGNMSIARGTVIENAVGGSGFDTLIGNAAIGQFATVGTAPDGLVYFNDHSWAGETRVAGIYIDPLVANGTVVAGSDFDSQRRFQNDLLIGNISTVLGADDYDGDGLQEVYFALTDGTAYLHAYMHADGNIRYANYQNQQQVIDFLTANGFGPSTWAGWFPSGQDDSGDKAEGDTSVLPDAIPTADPILAGLFGTMDTGDRSMSGLWIENTISSSSTDSRFSWRNSPGSRTRCLPEVRMCKSRPALLARCSGRL